MKRKEKKYSLISLVLILVGYFVILAVHPLHAQLADSAWPMFKNDTRHTGLSPYAGPENNTLKWKYALPDGVVNESPAIGSDGTIYIPLGNSLFAINRDGSFKWRYDGHSMGSSTPAISFEGTIYIPWGNGLLALNPDGTLKWEYDTSSYFSNNYSSPSIGTNGIVYFGLGVDLFAIKPDGKLLWKYRVGEEVNSSPAIGDDGTIYVRGREDYLIALNSDGTEKWAINLGSTLSHTNMSPVIGPDGTIYTFGLMNAKHPSLPDLQTTGLHAINPDGTTKWVFGDIGFDDQSIHMTPAIDKNGTIYLSGSVLNVWGSQVFLAVNKSGILQWTFELPPPDYFSSSSPAIDTNGNIYFGTWGNHLYAFNSNGTLKWKFEALNNIDSSPAIGKDGMIYFGSWDGYLYAIGEAIRKDWQTAYNVLFDNKAELDLMRQYRDKILSQTEFGKTFKDVLYNHSEEALGVLLDNPALLAELKELIQDNKGAVSDTLNGGKGVVHDTEALVSFLDEYAAKSPPALKVLVWAFKKGILAKWGREKPFLGFFLR